MIYDQADKAGHVDYLSRHGFESSSQQILGQHVGDNGGLRKLLGAGRHASGDDPIL